MKILKYMSSSIIEQMHSSYPKKPAPVIHLPNGNGKELEYALLKCRRKEYKSKKWNSTMRFFRAIKFSENAAYQKLVEFK